MDEEDEAALKQINAKLSSGVAPCTEDQFEEVMAFFEEATATAQPYASIDRPPVQSLEELEQQYDEAIPPHVRTYAKLVYEHWYARRTGTGNLSIAPRLKFELGQESDDTDPYVCFRRRELRQPRKTRNRDAQSAEKLRRLRMELETARNLLTMVRAREQARKQALELDKQLFEQRQMFRDTKRKLGIKSDDDLLVNQKVRALRRFLAALTYRFFQKQKVAPPLDPNQAAIAQQLRIPMTGGSGGDLRTLEDVRNEKQRAIDLEIQNNVEKHIRWNEGFVDKTKAPLTPVAEKDFLDNSTQFLEAMPAAYLPTPPASISEDEARPDEKPDVEMKNTNQRSRSSTPFRYASPMEDDGPAMPSFRRRVGRGGRIIIDRKMPLRPKAERVVDDRFKFDDSDDDDIDEATETNEDDIYARMAHRSYLLLSRGAQSAAIAAATVHAQRAQPEAANTSTSPAQSNQTQTTQAQHLPAAVASS